MAVRRTTRLLVGVVCIAAVGIATYFAAIRYLAWRESESPSAGRVLVLKDGRRIPLQQPGRGEPGGVAGSADPDPAPTAPMAPMAPTPTSPEEGQPAPTPGPAEPGGAFGSPEQAGGSAPDEAPALQVMPPIRLAIPGTASEWPVVLSNGVQLPRFRAIGWLLGSAYPGSPGNMVLFGHVDGKYATLERLKEVAPGDLFSVFTSHSEYVYRVRSVFETTPNDVGVLAPTENATATLITCAGRWDAADGMYDRRLVVVADYSLAYAHDQAGPRNAWRACGDCR